MISCSKGTYIRTLGEDISKALGTVGHLSSLRRIACGPWREEQMHTEEQILANPEKYILTLEQALDWPVIEISKQEFDFLLQGKSPKISIPKDISGHLFLKSEGNIIGFGEAQQGKLCWRKFLVTD